MIVDARDDSYLQSITLAAGWLLSIFSGENALYGSISCNNATFGYAHACLVL